MTVRTIVSNVPMGDVFVRDFDKGVYKSLDYFKQDGYSFVPLTSVPGVSPPMWCENHNVTAEIGTLMPGIPIIFGNPDDSVKRYNIPCFRINAEDPSPALERRRSIHLKSRSPAPGANEVIVTFRDGTTQAGYDSYEEQYGSWPYDIPYTLTCEAAGNSARQQATEMLRFIMKKFPPYAVLEVDDSLGETREYNCFVEGPSELTEVADIRDRTVIKALSIRVSAEYDLEDFRRVKPVTSAIKVNGATMNNKP